MRGIYRKPIFYLALLVAFSVAGCYSGLSDLEVGDVQWSPELGLPLVDSKFTLTEILEANSTNIDYTTDANNTIVITISEDSLFSQSATEYFSLSSHTINIPPIFLTPDEIETFNSTGQVTINREVNADYPNEGDLDEILIDQGTFETRVLEDFPADVDLSFSLQDPNNTTIVDYSNLFAYDGFNPVDSDEELSQFNNIGFVFNADPSLRQVTFDFTIELTKVNDQNLVLGANSINVETGFQDLEFGALYGDLSPQNISTEENTIRTDFFNEIDELSEIEYYFENPQFKIIFTNSMGIPIRFDVNNFTTYKNGESSEEPINNTINLEASAENSETRTEADFDAIFKDIINNVPDSVSLQVDGLIDPDNTPNNFVTRDSYFQAGYEVNLPLEFSLSGFEINETVSLDGIDPQELQYALFKFTSENSLPIDLDFKADLLSEDSTVVMNLFDGKFLAAGTENQPEAINDIIRLEDNPDTNANDLENLKNVKRIGIRATVATANNGNSVVRITSDASVQFNLAVQAKYNVNL